MHSSETQPAGPGLLLQLGRLILRARCSSATAPTPAPVPATSRHKHKPSTSQQVLIQTQPMLDEEDTRLEDNFRNHINALWTENVPICVEVSLGPACSECYATMSSDEPAFPLRGLLLERWTMQTVLDKSESPAAISSPWLLNAVRSQLHFSQLAAWRARSTDLVPERRRKLSREQCTLKKPPNIEDERKLNIVYSIKTPGCNTPFAKPPTDHTFPLTDIGHAKYLKVLLESLPRLDDIPEVMCACPKEQTDELLGKLNDLTIGSRKFDGAINSNIGTPARRLSIISNPDTTEYHYTINKTNLLDDRMHTTCNENGKHKCKCDDESEEKNQPKKLDEKRLKEIAKYKRRIRKEKVKTYDSTSSEGEIKKETTSIAILQASRFDRFRAIGCYRNQTYLTLPASRIETKSPFINTDSVIPPESKSKSVSTQTDFACSCGFPLEVKCDNCASGMVRSDGTYNLSSLQENGVRRKLEDHVDDDDKSLKKHKCDSINNVNSFIDGFIKRPKLRRFFPIVDRLEKIVSDRNHNAERDMRDLHLRNDDSVFSTARETKMLQKNQFSESRKLPQKTDCQFSGNIDQFSIDKECRKLPQRTDCQSTDKESKMSQHIHGQFSKDKESVCTQQTMDTEFKNMQGTDGLFSIANGFKNLQQDVDSQFSIDKQSSSSPKRTDAYKNLLQRTDECKCLPQRTDDQFSTTKESKRQKTFSISDDDCVLYEKCDYGTIDRHETESPKEELADFKFSIPERNGENEGTENIESLKHEFVFPDPKCSDQIPSPGEMDRFRWRFDSTASMVFHAKTGLPLTSSPAPLRRGNNCFDFDDSINGINGIKSALFHPISSVSPAPPAASPPPPRRGGKLKMGSTGLLGSFEESALQGRLEAVATVQGFTAELAASGAFCPPHRRLPVTVSFYAPGGTAAPYMGHISLGPGGYRVSRAGSIQVSLFNPHGTLVKMFVVLYDLSRMPPAARTFLRQRTLHATPHATSHATPHATRLRYLIHLRFMTSKSGKLYLHTDIRLIVSRKADLDTAAAHSALRPLRSGADSGSGSRDGAERTPNRVFGGSSEHDSERGYDNASVSYELTSVTYAPDNPKYSPR